MENLTAEILTKELKEKTFNYLKNNNIKLPIEVDNALTDLFDENDFISYDDDTVNIYFSEDIEDFETDTMCLKKLNVQVKSGNSSGEILDKYSYYGELSTDNAYFEDIALYDGEEKLSQLSYIEATKTNKLVDPLDFCIVLIEETEFHMGEYNVTPRVYIYVPTSGEGIL